MLLAWLVIAFYVSAGISAFFGVIVWVLSYRLGRPNALRISFAFATGLVGGFLFLFLGYLLGNNTVGTAIWSSPILATLAWFSYGFFGCSGTVVLLSLVRPHISQND